jgi:hypothetical protein
MIVVMHLSMDLVAVLDTGLSMALKISLLTALSADLSMATSTTLNIAALRNHMAAINTDMASHEVMTMFTTFSSMHTSTTMAICAGGEHVNLEKRGGPGK